MSTVIDAPIYKPLQLAFIKYIKDSIANNKSCGYFDLKNHEIQAKFNFKKQKLSKFQIESLLAQTRSEFHFVGKGKARQIFLSRQHYLELKSTRKHTDNLQRTSSELPANYLPTSSELPGNLLNSNPEPLEPQGIQAPLILDTRYLILDTEYQILNTCDVNNGLSKSHLPETSSGVNTGGEDFLLSEKENQLKHALEEVERLKVLVSVNQAAAVEEPKEGKPKVKRVTKASKDYEYTDEFEEAWNLYGRTGKKQAAYAAWLKAIQRASPEIIKENIPRYLRSKRVAVDGYKQYFSTWLNEDCWESAWPTQLTRTPEELKEKLETDLAYREKAQIKHEYRTWEKEVDKLPTLAERDALDFETWRARRKNQNNNVSENYPQLQEVA